MVHLLLLNTKEEGNMLMFQNKKQDENLVFLLYININWLNTYLIYNNLNLNFNIKWID